jgi:cardiolipin synthase
MPFWEYLSVILYLSYLLMAIYASAVIIYRKLDPVKSLSWIVVILLLPYIGLLLYLFFGQNFRKRKIFNRKGIRDERVRRIAANIQLKHLKTDKNYLPEHIKPFMPMIMLNLRSCRSTLGVNRKIDLYLSGKEALDAMLTEIKKAVQHIHLQSYIFEDDIIGTRFKNLLIEKASEGVEVRVIYDDVGCWGLTTDFKNDLIKNGVELLSFSPVRFITPTSKLNYRNHRKILVVDGITGFIGGVNIADRYYTGGNFSEWRDTHIKIEGESVAALQSSFLLDRYFIINQQFKRRKKYYPITVQDNFEIDIKDNHIYSQIITSGPDSDWASIMQCYFSAITNAKKHIFIITPYFTPNESILNAIKIASLGGVEVSLMIPEKSDTNFAHWSTLSYATELLEAGVKVYLFGKGFNHSKVISIDGEFCIIGSANMDNRSLEHNFEITGIIYNNILAQKIEKQFIKDTDRCKSLATSKWAKRGIKNQIKESFARLLSPLI